MKDVTDLMDGMSGSLARSGASAIDAKSSFTNFFPMLSTGTLTQTQFKSFMTHDPLLIKTLEEALGHSMMNVKKILHDGCDAAARELSIMLGVLANNGVQFAASASRVRRTFSEAMTQLSNTWKLTIGSINSDTGFMEKINHSVDRLKDLIGGPAMKAALQVIIDGGVTILDTLSRWLLTGDSIATTIDRWANRFSNLASIISAALKDLITGVTVSR